MKKEYVNSQITVVVFQTEDVIRTSGGEYATNGTYSEGGDWSGFSQGA